MVLQVIQNACATQAIINMLLNTKPESGITIGPILEEFRNFTQSFDPMVSFLQLISWQFLRVVSNPFKPPCAWFLLLN